MKTVRKETTNANLRFGDSLRPNRLLAAYQPGGTVEDPDSPTAREGGPAEVQSTPGGWQKRQGPIG